MLEIVPTTRGVVKNYNKAVQAGVDPKPACHGARFAAALISACGIPCSHHPVRTKTFVDGGKRIAAETSATTVANQIVRRKKDADATADTTAVQNARSMNVPGYGSISRNSFGFHQR